MRVTVGFVGRERELALLDKRLERVAISGRGTALAIRGRRQVGKSRLVQEFCDRAQVPYFFFTAASDAMTMRNDGRDLRLATSARTRAVMWMTNRGKTWPRQS